MTRKQMNCTNQRRRQPSIKFTDKAVRSDDYSKDHWKIENVRLISSNATSAAAAAADADSALQ
jgi:hypothetical protein